MYLTPAALLAQHWEVNLEEPTGIYRRTSEPVAVPLSQLGGAGQSYQVTDAAGRPRPAQATAGNLVFSADVRPGDRPVYRISACPAPDNLPQPDQPLARRIGANRVELSTARFRATIDLRRAAFVEFYPLVADRHRTLNLVEASPETKDKNDIHEVPARLLKPVSPIQSPPVGWTSLGGSGPFEDVRIVASGPVIARVELVRKDESWELTFPASGEWLRWKARAGFRFSNLSAAPFLPFDRFSDGNESLWPTGPEDTDPPDSSIGPRNWRKPAGGHFVYYRKQANYGALGIVSLDSQLEWRGAGSAKFEARKLKDEPAEIVLTLPGWNGNRTILEARAAARKVLQPILATTPRLSSSSSCRVPDPPPSTNPIPPAPQQPIAARTVDLNGPWQLAWGEKGNGPSSEWRTVKVPGTAHIQWLRPEQVFTSEANWVSTKEWWYKRTFTVPTGWAGMRIRLEFDATDYFAEVLLDGVVAGRHEGYIDPYGLDITGFVKPGSTHELKVRVWTPVSYYWRHRPYTIKGSYGAVDQKPDEITAVGITRGVRLRAWRMARIEDVAVSTWLRDSNAATVDLDLDAEGDCASCFWAGVLAPHNFSGSRSHTAATTGRQLRIDVPDARLWSTWDRGQPNLYDLTVRLYDPKGLLLDERKMRVGIREFERIGSRFYLNRQPLFLRGTNTYFHLFQSEMNRAAYERDVTLMREMNVNLIRLHCHFANPEFYDLADEMGILVWQDFLEAWYPRDTEFSVHAAGLYDNHIPYVRNHPSVAVWAACDEEDYENYTDLSKHLAARAALLDPQRRIVIRSTGRYDDAHLYHGWYGDSIYDYTRMTDNLVTELGATSLPARESLERFLAGKFPFEKYPDDWRFHKLQIDEALKAWGPQRKLSTDEYVARSQRYSATLFRLAIERARQRKPEGSAGIFHFFAIDIWPSVTMAAIDFYRKPKADFYQVQQSFQPVLASPWVDRERYPVGKPLEIPIWLYNDTLDQVRGARLTWRIEGTSASGSLVVDCSPDSSQAVGTVRFTPKSPGKYRIRTELDQPVSQSSVELIVSAR